MKIWAWSLRIIGLIKTKLIKIQQNVVLKRKLFLVRLCKAINNSRIKAFAKLTVKKRAKLTVKKRKKPVILNRNYLSSKKVYMDKDWLRISSRKLLHRRPSLTVTKLET